MSSFRIAIAIIGLLALATPAYAQTPVIDATSIAKEVQILANATQQLEQEEQIVNTAQSQLTQLQQSGQALSAGQWTGVQSLVGQIQNSNEILSTTAQMNGTVQAQFQQIFPTYTPTINWSAQFQQMNAATTASEAQALSVANTANTNNTAVNTALAHIASTTPAGQTQALQQVIQVCAIMVQQINRLVALQAASMKMMAYYYQQQQQQQPPNNALVQAMTTDPFTFFEQQGTTP